MVKRLIKMEKGQMKIQQTAFMLLAVTLFFALVGLAFVSFQLSGVKKSATDLQEKNARLLVSKLAESPEFSCGEVYGTGKISCVDLDKVMKLKENQEIYQGFWGVSEISVRRIYPKMTGTVVCTPSNYPNCNVIEMRVGGRGGTFIPNYVALCRKDSENGRAYDKCEMGLLMVSYEDRQ